MSEYLKVLFVMPSLIGGGAEHVVVHLANGLVQKNYKVTVALTKSSEIYYSLDPQIEVHYVEINNATPIQQIKFIREEIYKVRPQTVISFLAVTNMYTLLATVGFKIKVIVSERNDPRKTIKNNLSWKCLRGILYLRASTIVFQTKEAMGVFNSAIRRKGVIIPNPLPDKIPARYTGSREKRLVTVARLAREKNIPMLLRACRKVFEQYPEYILEIYGEGGLEHDLKRYAKELGIASHVLFKGFVNNIPEKIRTATAFLLTSDYEGISNAMLEAMATGLPCICTDCPIGGARKYINSMKNGILVPVGDEKAVEDAVLKVIGNESLQESLSREAVRIREELHVDRILSQWIELF